jgi:hypothetical protein
LPSVTNLQFQTELTAEWEQKMKALWEKAAQPPVAGDRQVILPPNMSEEKKQQILQEMAKQPASQEYLGNTITAQNFRMKTDSTEEKLSDWTLISRQP